MVGRRFDEEIEPTVERVEREEADGEGGVKKTRGCRRRVGVEAIGFSFSMLGLELRREKRVN